VDNTPLTLRIPSQVKTRYVTNPEWAKKLRGILQNVAVRTYQADTLGSDQELEELRDQRQRAEDLAREARLYLEKHEVELFVLDEQIKSKESELKEQAALDREAREKQDRVRRALNALGRNSRDLGKNYALSLSRSGLHLTNPRGVIKAIRADFGVELDEDELQEFVRIAKEE
jgi:hypothetical protein